MAEESDAVQVKLHGVSGVLSGVDATTTVSLCKVCGCGYTLSRHTGNLDVCSDCVVETDDHLTMPVGKSNVSAVISKHEAWKQALARPRKALERLDMDVFGVPVSDFGHCPNSESTVTSCDMFAFGQDVKGLRTSLSGSEDTVPKEDSKNKRLQQGVVNFFEKKSTAHTLDSIKNTEVLETRKDCLSKNREHTELLDNRKDHLSKNMEHTEVLDNRKDCLSKDKEHTEVLDNRKDCLSKDKEHTELLENRKDCLSEDREHTELLENRKDCLSKDREHTEVLDNRKDHFSKGREHTEVLENRKDCLSKDREHTEVLENRKDHLSKDREHTELLENRKDHLSKDREHTEVLENRKDHLSKDGEHKKGVKETIRSIFPEDDVIVIESDIDSQSEDDLIVITAEKPACIEDNVAVITAEKPASIEDDLAVITAEKPACIDDDVAVITAEKSASIEDDLAVITAEKQASIEDDVAVITAEKPASIDDDVDMITAKKPASIDDDHVTSRTSFVGIQEKSHATGYKIRPTISRIGHDIIRAHIKHGSNKKAKQSKSFKENTPQQKGKKTVKEMPKVIKKTPLQNKKKGTLLIEKDIKIKTLNRHNDVLDSKKHSKLEQDALEKQMKSQLKMDGVLTRVHHNLREQAKTNQQATEKKQLAQVAKRQNFDTQKDAKEVVVEPGADKLHVIEVRKEKVVEGRIGTESRRLSRESSQDCENELLALRPGEYDSEVNMTKSEEEELLGLSDNANSNAVLDSKGTDVLKSPERSTVCRNEGSPAQEALHLAGWTVVSSWKDGVDTDESASTPTTKPDQRTVVFSDSKKRKLDLSTPAAKRAVTVAKEAATTAKHAATVAKHAAAAAKHALATSKDAVFKAPTSRPIGSQVEC